MAKVKLIWVGDVTRAFVPGVPAQDIEVDADQADDLVKTGCYERAPTGPAAKAGKDADAVEEGD